MSNQALVLTKPQGEFVLQSRSKIQPGAGEIVVRNHAIALAPITWKLRDIPGFAESMNYKNWPSVLGSELAGVVDSVGPSVSHFKPGDRVMGFSLPGANSGDANRGAFQEYTVVHTHLAALIPDDLTFREACILPASIITAVGLLLDLGFELDAAAAANNKSGEALLIWGGSGAVGSCTLQIAKALGLKVVTTASARHANYLRGLGADIVVDRNSPSHIENIKSEAAASGLNIAKFIDASSADLPTTANVVSALGGGDLATLIPWEMLNKTAPPSNVRPFQSGARRGIADQELAAEVMHDLVESWLVSKELRPTNIEVVPGGLLGVEAGLSHLKEGLSGVKLVLDIVA